MSVKSSRLLKKSIGDRARIWWDGISGVCEKVGKVISVEKEGNAKFKNEDVDPVITLKCPIAMQSDAIA